MAASRTSTRRRRGSIPDRGDPTPGDFLERWLEGEARRGYSFATSPVSKSTWMLA